MALTVLTWTVRCRSPTLTTAVPSGAATPGALTSRCTITFPPGLRWVRTEHTGIDRQAAGRAKVWETGSTPVTVPVTTTPRTCATSASVTTYVPPTAPSIGTPLRVHW